MGRFPYCASSRLSPVKAFNVALLLLLHLAYTVVASPAAVAESKQGEEVPCPLLPSSAPSKAAFERCVECTSTYAYGWECCSEVVEAFGVGTYEYPTRRKGSSLERGIHGCDRLRGYSVEEDSGWISSEGEIANIRQIGGQDDHVDCQEICADTPHCVAYTFVEADGRCDLKDSAAAWKLSGGSGLVSGKLEEVQQGRSSN